MASVKIIHCDPALQKLLELLVERCDGYETAGNGPADLILLDTKLLRGIAELQQSDPGARVLAVCRTADFRRLSDARAAGADGFWFLEPSVEALSAALNQTMAGVPVWPAAAPEVRLGNACSADFTERELLVLREVAAGAMDEEISERLRIAVRTVKTHIQNMRAKTGCRNRTDLAVQAVKAGLVTVE